MPLLVVLVLGFLPLTLLIVYSLSKRETLDVISEEPIAHENGAVLSGRRGW